MEKKQKMSKLEKKEKLYYMETWILELANIQTAR